MNTSATDPATLRYYSDDEIAAVVYQMLTGVRYVRREQIPLSWWRATRQSKRKAVAAVQAVKRNADATELLELCDQVPVTWDHLTSSQRLRVELVRVVVATMAGSAR
jgi:hypothetical protein